MLSALVVDLWYCHFLAVFQLLAYYKGLYNRLSWQFLKENGSLGIGAYIKCETKKIGGTSVEDCKRIGMYLSRETWAARKREKMGGAFQNLVSMWSQMGSQSWQNVFYFLAHFMFVDQAPNINY